MANRNGEVILLPRDGPCLHRANVPFIDVVRVGHDHRLRMYACGLCHRRWWLYNDNIIGLPEALRMIKDAARMPRSSPVRRLPGDGARQERLSANAASARRPEQEPAFLALIAWVSRAIGADLFLFATNGPAGWQITGHAQAVTRTEAVAQNDRGYEPSLAAEATRYEGLMKAVAERRGPTELTGDLLVSACPSLVAAGIEYAVGTPVYAPSGALVAAVVAAYRARPAADQITSPPEAAPAGLETIACMGKLLTTAQHRLLSPSTLPIPAPPVAARVALVGRSLPRRASDHSPDDLLVSREVAAIFAVCPRTIANWVRRGMLATTRTAGGHLRFRRQDVQALLEDQGLEWSPDNSEGAFSFASGQSQRELAY
jgi:excisionase family DNA binding protein